MQYSLLFSIFCLATALSLFLTPLMRKIASRTKLLAPPGRRRVHTKPVPYLGGVAIYLTFISVILFIFCTNPHFKAGFSEKFAGFLIASTLIVVLGVWDDAKHVKPLIKLLAQVCIVLILFAAGFRIEVLTNPFVGGEVQIPLVFSVIITILWFLGMINAMNLIDGLDGLAAGITVIVSSALFFISLYLDNYLNVLLLVVLAGSTLGFLRYNFYPAQIFMGDAGSMFLGLVLASVALLGSQHKSATAVALLTPITALALPIFDTGLAVVRRALKKVPIFRADSQHLHHRLLKIGLDQRQIVLFLYTVTAYLGIFAFLFVLIPEHYALLLLMLLALGLFMGLQVVGFIEKKVRVIQRLRVKKRKYKKIIT
jgi:UDP-GlcNAc:undecaprenyl-phosphate GlcNAc-1-phosphate transferase